MNLNELEARAKAATPGPWHSPGLGEVHCEKHFVIVDVLFNDGSGDDSVGNGTQEDATFIAAANPETILRLIELVREMAAALDDYEYTDSTAGNAALAKFRELTK